MFSNQFASAIKRLRQVIAGAGLGSGHGDGDDAVVDAELLHVGTGCEESPAQMGDRLGIKIICDAPNNHSVILSWDRLDDQLITAGTELLSAELSIYPLNIIRKSQIREIVMCTNLRRSGVGISGCNLAKGDTLVFDVSKFKDNWHYGRKVVHHELFHAIDFHDDPIELLDPWWESLNAPGVRYSGKKDVHNAPCQVEGFVTSYAMQFVHEDKAEVFSELIVDYKKVEARGRTDTVVRRKVGRMKQLLLQFAPEFDDDFWQSRRDDQSVVRIRIT